MYFVLSFAIWIVIVYSMRLALCGSPTYSLVHSVPQPVLAEAMDCINAAEPPENDHTYRFLRQYLLVRLQHIAVFWAEVACTIYFLLTDFWLAIPLFLLLKQIAAWKLLHKQPDDDEEERLLQLIRDEPAWTRRWDRINHLVTVVCFTALFLRLQGWV